MKILGIESSCDETAASVVENGVKILSSVVASSQEIHAETGGIIPEQAARQQIKSIIPVIDTALNESNLTLKNIDTIAVTAGPGLIGSLLVGVETAKTLSLVYKKPIIPINHLIAHIYANWLERKRMPSFPAIALVVSGGHTDMIFLQDHPKKKEDIQYLGGTRDDAAGEAFDKTARLLSLPYPGGPAIAKEAEKFLKTKKKPTMTLPRPMLYEDNFDFSFSGLKTAILYKTQELKAEKKFNSLTKQELACQLQEAIVDVLTEKCIKAVKKYKPQSFLLAGGVAANKRLSEAFKTRTQKEEIKVNFYVPPPNLCTDNAAYIASCAYFNCNPTSWKKISAQPQLSILD